MKKIPLFSNIFSKSRPAAGPLETDAVPVDDPPDSISSNLDNSNNNSLVNSGDFNAALQLQNQMAESAELSMMRASSNTEVIQSPTGNNTSITNNQMDVHNTQGQVVMQFSNISGLHFGPSISINSVNLEQPANESTAAAPSANRNRPRRTTTIEAMMRSSEELNHRMLDTISTHLGEGWRNVLRDLGCSDGQIDQGIIDHQMHGGIKEVIYMLLLDWIRNAEDGEATLSVITQLLWKSGHRECVQKMKLTWKQEKAAQKAE